MIAVAGTLLGAAVAGLIQHRTARDAARVDQRRDRELEAVTALASALATHRSTMFARGDLCLSGGDTDRLAQLCAEVHAARSAIESPRVLVSVLVPALAPAAAAAAKASYALRWRRRRSPPHRPPAGRRGRGRRSRDRRRPPPFRLTAEVARGSPGTTPPKESISAIFMRNPHSRY